MHCLMAWELQMSELPPEHVYYATEVLANTYSIEATPAGTHCTNGTNWYMFDYGATRTKQYD